jgi:hypothetical protein
MTLDEFTAAMHFWAVYFIMYRLFIRPYMHQRIITRGTTEDEYCEQQQDLLVEVQVVDQEPYSNVESSS